MQITNRNVLTVSLVVSSLLLVVNYVGTYALCGGNAGTCVDVLYNLVLLFEFFLPLFLLSLITYKLRDEIFRAWLIFAKWWVPLTIILVLLAPTTGYSLVPIDKGRVSLFMNALFLILSLLLIAYKSYQLRRER